MLNKRLNRSGESQAAYFICIQVKFVGPVCQWLHINKDNLFGLIYREIISNFYFSKSHVEEEPLRCKDLLIEDVLKRISTFQKVPYKHVQTLAES